MKYKVVCRSKEFGNSTTLMTLDEIKQIPIDMGLPYRMALQCTDESPTQKLGMWTITKVKEN